eukprot:scaffold842_cov101-Skeletonema_dohrnii-CCMP3373.AAC.2
MMWRLVERILRPAADTLARIIIDIVPVNSPHIISKRRPTLARILEGYPIKNKAESCHSGTYAVT